MCFNKRYLLIVIIWNHCVTVTFLNWKILILFLIWNIGFVQIQNDFRLRINFSSNKTITLKYTHAHQHTISTNLHRLFNISILCAKASKALQMPMNTTNSKCCYFVKDFDNTKILFEPYGNCRYSHFVIQIQVLILFFFFVFMMTLMLSITQLILDKYGR